MNGVIAGAPWKVAQILFDDILEKLASRAGNERRRRDTSEDSCDRVTHLQCQVVTLEL